MTDRKFKNKQTGGKKKSKRKAGKRKGKQREREKVKIMPKVKRLQVEDQSKSLIDYEKLINKHRSEQVIISRRRRTSRIVVIKSQTMRKYEMESLPLPPPPPTTTPQQNEYGTSRLLVQRRAACLRERTRMRAMNGVFDILRSKVPYTVNTTKRISKIDTLR